MKKRRETVLLILLLVLALIFGLAADGCTSSGCRVNSDCVKVQTTCCSCEMGGEELCVQKIEVSNYQSELKDCPPEEELICPAVYNCRIKDCKCIDGSCVEIRE